MILTPRLHKFLLLFLLAFLITSCKVGPDYQKPTVSIPKNYKEAKKKKWVKAKPADLQSRGNWWTVFHDKKLNQLELALNISNQNITSAIAQYAQARALVDEARASFFPNLAASASLVYQNNNNGFGGGGSAVNNSSNINVNNSNSGNNNNGFIFGNGSSQIGLNASWEPDIWGATRRDVEAATAGAESSAANLGAVQLSEQASLAQYYFELRGVDSDQVLLNKTVVADKKILTLTKNQYHFGTASMMNVAQARGQLETAQANAIKNGVNRALYEHAIAVLIGKPPAELTLKSRPFFGKPPTVAAELPSQLLERRPDIAQAERNVAQANANIGVAVSAYYPSVILTPSFTAQNNQATDFNDWFSFPLLVWSVGTNLAETIFDGGLRHATVAAAKANYQSTVAIYRQTVLTAFQNVEDNLAALRILKNQAVAQNAAARDAQLTLALTVNQFQQGTVAYPNVYTAQVSAYAAEKNAVDVTTLRMTYTVALIKALGGNWGVNAPSLKTPPTLVDKRNA